MWWNRELQSVHQDVVKSRSLLHANPHFPTSTAKHEIFSCRKSSMKRWHEDGLINYGLCVKQHWVTAKWHCMGEMCKARLKPTVAFYARRLPFIAECCWAREAQSLALVTSSDCAEPLEWNRQQNGSIFLMLYNLHTTLRPQFRPILTLCDRRECVASRINVTNSSRHFTCGFHAFSGHAPDSQMVVTSICI